MTAISSGSPGGSGPLSYRQTIICIILIAISLRPGIVSIAPILSTIRDYFDLSHSEAALLTSIPDVLMGALALPSPWLARRFGRDRVILCALILLCISIFARAIAPDTATLLLTTAGVGAGIAIAGALIAGFVKASFPSKAAFLMGIYGTALGTGTTISAAISGPVATAANSWRFGAGLWVVPCLIAIGTWLFVERHSGNGDAVKTAGPRYRLPLRNKTAWLIALFFACDNLLFYACLTWIAPVYRESGFSTDVSGYILALYTLGFLISNPIFGTLSRNEDRRILLAIAAVLTLAGLSGLTILTQAAPFLFAPIIGFGIGGGFTLGMTLPLDNTDDPDEANVWNAFMLTIGYLIAATGPFLVGALRDVTGGFSAGMWLLIAVGTAMLGLTPFLQPHRHKQHGR